MGTTIALAARAVARPCVREAERCAADGVRASNSASNVDHRSAPRKAACAAAAAASSLHFVASEAIDAGLADRLGTTTALTAVGDTRGRTKADMIGNDALPAVTVDPDSFAVYVDGDLVEPAPVDELPMAQRYFLF